MAEGSGGGPPEVAAEGGLLAPSRRGLTVGLVLTITLVAFEALAVITILPAIKDDLDGISLYGWATSAFQLGVMVGIVVAGGQADRRGPVPPFLAGIALFAVGLVVGGLAPTMLVLVLGRGLQGLGAGAVPAVAYAIIGRSFPEALRPLIGNRVYGCDDCQLVCPWNKFARAAAHPDFRVRHGLDSARLEQLFLWTEAEFEQRMAGSAIRRIGWLRWLRNLAVALGNAPHSEARQAALRARASHPSELVREHVQWALEVSAGG